MALNVNTVRSETPGTKNVIHFNNAGASLMPQAVADAVTNYLHEELDYGGYETAEKWEEELNAAYKTMSNFINAGPQEIALLENATAAWNMAFFSISFKGGDRILTSVAEYASNYIAYLHLQKKVQVKIDVIPNDKHGQTSVKALEERMDDDVKLISITHIPTNSGLVNPVEKIGDIAGQYNCLYLVDACQSVGHYPVDVKKVGCDMLSATGRKYLRGPRGTGFLYVNEEALPRLTPPFLDLHSAEWTSKNEYQKRDDARQFENWEANYAGILGLKTAVEYATDIGIETIWNRITGLAEELRWKLAELPSVMVRDMGDIKCGIVTFTVDGFEASILKEQLHKRSINVSISTKRSTLLDMQQRELEEVVRASVHYYNNSEEIERLVTALESITQSH